MDNLRLCLLGAYYAGNSKHGQLIMKELGISYEKCISQPIADQWMFFNCKNIPEKLPDYITEIGEETLKHYK